MEGIQAMLDLFNLFDSVQPKIVDIEEIYTGRIIQQMIYFLNDTQLEDQQIFEDNDNNFMLTFKIISDQFNKLKEYLDKSKIIHDAATFNAMKFAKDKDQMEALNLFQLLLIALMYGDKKEFVFENVLTLPETQQQLIIQSLGCQDLNQSSQSQQPNQIFQNDNQLLIKLSELENENYNLKLQLKQIQDDFEQQQQENLTLVKELKQEKTDFIQHIQQLESSISDVLDKLQKPQLNDILILVEEKDRTIEKLNYQFESFKREQKKKDDSNLQKSGESEQTIQKLNRKISQLSRVENQNEEMIDKLEQNEIYLDRYNQECINHKATRQLIETVQQEVTAAEAKFKKYKKIALEEKSQKEKYEFEITRLEDSQFKLAKQVEQRESQIQMLSKEIDIIEEQNIQLKTDNGRTKNQTLRQQGGIPSINNSQYNQLESDNNFSRRMTITNMMSQKRNLSIELGSCITARSENNEEIQAVRRTSVLKKPNIQLNSHREQQAFKTQILESDSESDTEQNRSDVQYWRLKAENLLAQVLELEDNIRIQNHEQNNLDQKYQVFLNQQVQYQKELNQAQNYFKTYAKDIEEQRIQIENLTTEKEQLQTALRENAKILEKLTESIHLSNQDNNYPSKKTSKKDSLDKHQVQLLEKQNKILKKKFEEELIQKDNMLKLVISALLELQNGVITYKHGNSQNILSNEHLETKSMNHLEY